MKYQQIKQLKPEQFKRYTGIKPKTFEKMVEILTQAYQEKHKQGGINSTITIEDQLLITLCYYREYRTYFHIGIDYGITESATYKIIKWVEQVLIEHPDLSLPSKKALWQENSDESILIDATETPIERPKKSKS